MFGLEGRCMLAIGNSLIDDITRDEIPILSVSDPSGHVTIYTHGTAPMRPTGSGPLVTSTELEDSYAMYQWVDFPR